MYSGIPVGIIGSIVINGRKSGMSFDDSVKEEIKTDEELSKEWWNGLTEDQRVNTIKRFPLTVNKRTITSYNDNDIYLMWLGRNRQDI